MTRLLIFDYPH